MSEPLAIPYANGLFEQPWWLDIVAPGEWGEAIVKEGDEVVGRLPYALRHGNIVMPGLTQTLGPWIKPEYRIRRAGNSQLSRQKEIIGELISQLPKHKSFKLCFDSANDYILPYRWLGFRYEPSFSYRIKDLSDMNLVTSGFHKTVRKNIRRSQKVISVTNEPDAEILLDCMRKTFAHQGRKYPVSEDLVRRIVAQTSDCGHGRMFIARDRDGNVHSCSYLVYDDVSSYALLGGADPQFRGSGAKSLLWQNEIAFAAAKSAFFDFEGSNIESIERFVRQFGGERVTNYVISKQSLARDVADILKPRIKRLIGYKI